MRIVQASTIIFWSPRLVYDNPTAAKVVDLVAKRGKVAELTEEHIVCLLEAVYNYSFKEDSAFFDQLEKVIIE